MCVFIYFIFGLVIMAVYGLIDDVSFSFTCEDEKEKSCRAVILIVAWPFYVAYFVIKMIIWLIKHLYVSFSYFIEKGIKKAKELKPIIKNKKIYHNVKRILFNKKGYNNLQNC